MCDIDRNELNDKFSLVKLTARHGRTTGMLVKRLWARFREESWEECSHWLSSL